MTRQNTGVIYCLTNTVNDKQYIGQTVDFGNRIHKHLNGQSGCPVLSNAIEKYGTAAFRVEILEDNVPRGQLNKRESYFIREMDTLRPKGYNLTTGGDGSVPVAETRRRLSELAQARWKDPEFRKRRVEAMQSPEYRKRLSESLQSPEVQKHLSEARRGNTNRQGKTGQKHTDEWRKNHSAMLKGREQTPEHIEKRVNSRKGYTPTPETREKISKAKRGKKQSPEAIAKTANMNRGKKRTPEQRAKISAALKGKKKPPEHVAKMSIARRGKKLSPEHRAKISKALKGKRKRKKSSPLQT